MDYFGATLGPSGTARMLAQELRRTEERIGVAERLVQNDHKIQAAEPNHPQR